MTESTINYSISEELKVIPKVSSYSSISEFVEDAINTLLAARKDLRVDIACELYKEGKVSITKACEIAKVDIEEMKEILHDKGIKRHVLPFAETKKLADAAEKAIKS